MISRLKSRSFWRIVGGASLATVTLIAGGVQAIGVPGQTRFTIAWSLCEKSPQTQCGTLKVPIDWSKPSGAKISLVVARRPAKDPTQRVGRS